MPTPTDYTSGTLTLTNGSVDFTGTGTGWQAFAAGEGDFFAEIVGGEDFAPPIIATITSNTAGTLTRPWAGPTLTGVAYRMRHYWDSGRASAQSAQLREQLGNGNIVAFSALEGPGVPVFDGPHSLVIRPETDFINGVAYNVQVDDMAGRAAYDGQAAGFAVLVADVGNTFGLENAGRSAVFSKRTNTTGDWTDPAFVTGPPGIAPVITAEVEVLPSSGTAIVNVTPISGGYNLDFQLPAADGFYWEGDYNSANAYPKDSVVRRFGSSFIAIQDVPAGQQPSGATPPVDTTYWEVVAIKGADGAGTIVSLVSGTGITVDPTDPTQPIINLANVPTATIKGRIAAGTGAPTNLTGSQVTTLLDVFNTTRKGVVPQPSSADATALRLLAANGAWVDKPEGANYDSQISALALSLADLQGSRLAMKGGIADAFDDETGVDATASTNEVYDPTNDLYRPFATVGPQIPQATGTIIGSLTGNGGNAASFDGVTSQVSGAGSASGGGSLQGFVGKNFTSSPKRVGVAIVWPSSEAGFLYNTTGSVTLELRGKNGGSAPTAGADGVLLATISIADTTTQQTLNSTDVVTQWDYLWIRITTAIGDFICVAEVQFFEPGTINNMTLISVGYPVTAQSTKARLVLQLDTALTIVAGTDFSGEVSRNNGVTWTNAPLTLSSTLGTIKTYESDMVDLSAQSAGTIMKWRAKTLTNKNIAMSGVVEQWQ